MEGYYLLGGRKWKDTTCWVVDNGRILSLGHMFIGCKQDSDFLLFCTFLNNIVWKET